MKKFEDIVQEFGREQEAGLTSHPSDDHLLDHLHECLTPEQADEVQDHLTWCRRCTGKLQEMNVPLGFAVDPDPPALPEHIAVNPQSPTSRRLWIRPWLTPLLAVAATLTVVLLWPTSPQPSGTSTEITLSLNQRGLAPVFAAPSDTGFTLRLILPLESQGPFQVILTDPLGKQTFAPRNDLWANQKGHLVLHYPLRFQGALTAEVRDAAGQVWQLPFDIRFAAP